MSGLDGIYLADGFEIDHAGVAGEVAAAPGAAPVLDRRHVIRVHLPMVEGAVAAGLAAGMAPPARYAVDNGGVAADVIAFEQRAPHVAGPIGRGIVGLGAERAAADTHALEVVDRLGEDRIGGGAYAVRRGLEALTHSHCELVVDPAVRGIPGPGVAVLSWNEDVGRTFRTLEILSAPRVDFANRHLRPSGSRAEAIDSGFATDALQPTIVDGVACGAEVSCRTR